MSLAESVRLLSEQAAAVEPGQWPDFAMFDCQMCHHELQSPSWRQRRLADERLGPRPGQPRMRQWPTVLVELGIGHVHRGDAEARQQAREEFAELLTEFQHTFDGTAWGSSRAADNRLPSAAGALLDWLGDLSEQLYGASYDGSDARDLLIELCALGDQPSLDYDAARELAWALEAIGSALPSGEAPLADDWQRALAALDRELLLDLPATQQRGILDPLRQRAAYEAIGNYDPANVRRRFADVAKALSAE
ncbi:MAG TPA: hypothetical protein VF306_11680, partial [Pirellulales bacterium]